MNLRSLYLVQRNGQPFESHIDRALMGLVPKFCRCYPALREDLLLTEIFETAGRKIQAREERCGPIEHLHAYSWVALCTVAASMLRRGRLRLAQRTFAGQSAGLAIDRTPARYGSAESIERAILLRELLERLSPDERRICIWKSAGHTSREIAGRLGMTAGAVDTALSRIRRKLVKCPSKPTTGRRS